MCFITIAFVLQIFVLCCLAKPIALYERQTALARPTLKVLPLGDGITRGLESSHGNGYRWDLAHGVTTYDLEFVGTLKSGNMINNENEGHRGATIAQISNFSTEAFRYKPNVVLVLAGTNDIVQEFDIERAPQRLRALIDRLIIGIPGAVILVGTLPPIWYALPQRDAYNAAVASVVAALTEAGKHVLEVSMANVTLSDLKDDLHPNDHGYAVMAKCWESGLAEAQARGWLPNRPPVTSHITDSNISHSMTLVSSSLHSSLVVVAATKTSLSTSDAVATSSANPYNGCAGTVTEESHTETVPRTLYGSTLLSTIVTAPSDGATSSRIISFSSSVRATSGSKHSLSSTRSIPSISSSATSSLAAARETSSFSELPTQSTIHSKLYTKTIVSFQSSSTTQLVSSQSTPLPKIANPLLINTTYQDITKSAISVVTDTYNNNTKVWRNITGWIAAVVYQDMMDYDHWTGGNTYETVYGNSLLEIVTDYSLLRNIGAIDSFNDDQGWWVLAMLRAYENYGKVELLNEAIKQWKQIQATSQTSASDAGSAPSLGGLARDIKIPATCDVYGAVYWNQTPDSPLNAISTGLFAQMGAWLYAFTKDEQFREGADLALGWLRRMMLDPVTGIMNIDSISPGSCRKNPGSLTYNTGVYLSAITSLYSSTGEAQYLEWANLTATSSTTGFFGNEKSAPLVVTQQDNQINDDESYIWRDVLFRGLNEFNVLLKTKSINTKLQSQIKTFFEANYNQIQQHAKYGDSYSANWFGLMPGGTAWGTASVLSVLIGSMVIL